MLAFVLTELMKYIQREESVQMENDRTQNKKHKKNKIERIARIQYEKIKRIVEHKMNLHNSIARISQIAAIPVMMGFTTDHVTVKELDEDKNPNKFPTENTVGAVNSERTAIFGDFLAVHNQEVEKKFDEFVTERQEKFSKELYAKMTENISNIRASEKKGIKNKALRETFGKSINTRYYCTFGALSTINQVAESDGFQEFSFLNEYIENPHYCPSVINGLKNKDKDLIEDIDNYIQGNPSTLELNSFLKNISRKLVKNPSSEERGKILVSVKEKSLDSVGDVVGMDILQRIETYLEKAPIVVETNNIKKEIAAQMEKNPNSVLIVVHVSKENNNSSGKHAGLVMKKVNPETHEKGTTVFAGYNGEQIKNVDDYFQRSNNTGFVYNITEKAAKEFKKNNYNSFAEDYQGLIGNKELLAWAAVGGTKISSQNFDAKTMLLANNRNITH